MISPVLSRRRGTLIVRREDVLGTYSGRNGSRRARRRRSLRSTNRPAALAAAILLAAAAAWLLLFVYLLSVAG